MTSRTKDEIVTTTAMLLLHSCLSVSIVVYMLGNLLYFFFFNTFFQDRLAICLSSLVVTASTSYIRELNQDRTLFFLLLLLLLLDYIGSFYIYFPSRVLSFCWYYYTDALPRIRLPASPAAIGKRRPYNMSYYSETGLS